MSQIAELFHVACRKDLAETGGGHNQKGVNFQRVWALTRMFELVKEGSTDFLFLFETIQDVVELDSSVSPSTIQIYQVKKKDNGTWTWKDLTNLLEPASKKASTQLPSVIKNSPIGKLYSSVLAFKELKSSGRFISNAGCNLRLEGETNAATSLWCDLSQLEAAYLQLLSKGLDTLHEPRTLPANPSFIHIEKTPIHPDGSAIYLYGTAVSFLQGRSSKHASQATALVDALLAKIGPLGAKTDSYSTFDDLRKERGFSQHEFVAALGTLEQVPDQEYIIETWINELSSEKVVNFMDVPAIHIEVSKSFWFQLMGLEDPRTMALATDCDNWLDVNILSSGTSLKFFIEKAKADLVKLHPSFRTTQFIACFLTRMANKCVDQT